MGWTLVGIIQWCSWNIKPVLERKAVKASSFRRFARATESALGAAITTENITFNERYRVQVSHFLYRLHLKFHRDKKRRDAPRIIIRNTIIILRGVLFIELYTARSIILRHNEILWPAPPCIEWCYENLMVLVSRAPVLNTKRSNALYRLTVTGISS